MNDNETNATENPEENTGANEGTGAQGGAGETQQTGDQNQNSKNSNAGEKTFTQAELSAVATAEKNQGKNAILKIFGVKDEKAAKEQAKAFKEWQDAQKSAEDKVKEQEGLISEANAKALAAENKLTCLMSGVNKDSIEDALAIASSKVSDDKDLNTVLEEMKKEPRYSGFFNDAQGTQSKGTGHSAGHQGNNSGGTENIGARLGKAHSKGATTKSAYFHN